MTIYTRFGTRVTIEHNCGIHKVKGLPQPATLLQVVRHDSDDDPKISDKATYVFAHTLKADNGIEEVLDAVLTATHLDLNEDLQGAIDKAL